MSWQRRLRPLLALATVLACAPAEPGAPRERVTIPQGAALSQVTDTLVAHGIVSHPLWFKVLARVRRVDRAIQAGVYELPRGASAFQTLDALAAGRVASTRFIVPEGLTALEVSDLAEQNLGVAADSFMTAVGDPEVIAAMNLRARSVEGFLFPSTYLVPVGVSARELVQVMTQEFLHAWNPAWDARLDSLRMTRLQLVTLASIVEGEARHDEERAIIAGVYQHRLRLRMPLQADPTVQYALQLRTRERKPRLFTKDYQTPSPYNTYLNPGLPPGPVNSPGRSSIIAALYPAEVPYLYFVAGSDGHHIFSRTYDEHLAAVAKVRRMERAERQTAGKKSASGNR